MDAHTRIYLRIPDRLAEKRWNMDEVKAEVKNLIKKQLKNRKMKVPETIEIIGWRSAHWSNRSESYTGRGVLSLNNHVPQNSKLLEVFYTTSGSEADQ